jgi:diguanylate cyclase (GGDEF)-like protein
MAFRDENGVPTRIAGSQTDITDRRAVEEQLMHEAIHDSLTGLSNRAFFIDLLQNSLSRARRRSNYLFAVLFLDLDRFKVINDSLGHLIGDAFLIELARRLHGCLRNNDTVARLGGDEFAVLVDDIENEIDAIRVAERIQKELSLPFIVEGQEIFTSVSIGITVSSARWKKPGSLCL